MLPTTYGAFFPRDYRACAYPTKLVSETLLYDQPRNATAQHGKLMMRAPATALAKLVASDLALPGIGENNLRVTPDEGTSMRFALFGPLFLASLLNTGSADDKEAEKVKAMRNEVLKDLFASEESR